MEMDNLRVESHVAQKNRRHKLRFQHNSGDPTHNHLPHDPHFENLPTIYRPEFGSISYNPNIFPSEMQNPTSNNPHLLLPENDQDSGPDPGTRPGKPIENNSCNVVSYARKMITETAQNSSNWRSVISSPQPLLDGFYSNVGSICVDENNSNSCYGYNQDSANVSMGDQKHQGEVSGFGSLPFYQNILQEVVSSVTLAHPGHDQFGFIGNKSHDHSQETATMGTNGTNWSTQGLSLSLSSVPLAKNELSDPHSGPRALKTDLLANLDPKPPPFGHRGTGPLGPFTGYATILKNSKYLKPAQELLNENCDVGGQELVQKCDNTHKELEEELSRASGESGVSGRSSSIAQSGRPEFHQKKAKLLYMQEEVCRRYKQYHHQMQMVISSFETVAGLSAATPYVSLALKAVSRHFHLVKNAISEQLTQTKKTLEDLCSPTMGASTSKAFDGNTTNSSSQLTSMDRNFEGHGRSGGGMAGFFGAQPPVWRPQRGLPERAVSVLKAWLFDHFLHPYPSDADKHMLATQTGLTRNQVSNWFINARVRIWKPMVEEIHTLETKGSTEPKRDGMDMDSSTNRQQSEHSRNSETLINSGDDPNEQLWDHDRRYQQIPPAGMDPSFTPYPRTAGGTGPVSLTLGLRQNAENVQQLQQQEHQLRQHFGGQLIHDFVG